MSSTTSITRMRTGSPNTTGARAGCRRKSAPDSSRRRNHHRAHWHEAAIFLCLSGGSPNRMLVLCEQPHLHVLAQSGLTDALFPPTLRRLELMLWKLELACADAQAKVRPSSL